MLTHLSRSLGISLLVVLSLVLIPATQADGCEFRDVITELRDASSACVLVTAHRGAHGDAPENSLLAIENAIELGVDIIEVDLRFTRDGVPILLHDPTLDRTTTGSGPVSEQGFDEVRKLRLLTRDGQLTDQLIPTLTEALEAARGRVILDLDIKTGPVTSIVSRVVETQSLETALFFSGGIDTMLEIAAMHPGLLLMPRARDLASTRRVSRQFQPEVIHIDPSFNTDETSAAAAASDSRVWINALGQPDVLILTGRPGEAIEPLLAHGASIIQTDLPGQVLDYLRQTGRR